MEIEENKKSADESQKSPKESGQGDASLEERKEGAGTNAIGGRDGVVATIGKRALDEAKTV